MTKFKALLIVTLLNGALLYGAPVFAHSIVGSALAESGIVVRFAAAAETNAVADDANSERGSAAPGGVAVQFTYSGSFNGVPEGAEYKVYAPDDIERVYQSGRTDRLGRVVFQPDRPGAWHIELRTREGHEATADIDIDADLAVPPAPRWGWWLLFISLIANVALVVYFKQDKKS